jgi:maltose alpha-D-glucosyltransferase/alpha-amylase
VVANLSRFAQYVELDLSEYSGWVPVECFGRTEFPPIGTHPYLLTLGPHSFYWFVLMREVSPAGLSEGAPSGLARAVLKLGNVREAALHGRALSALEDLLPAYLRACRWFRGKARPIKSVRVIEVLSLSEAPESARIAMVRVEYVEGDGETYVLPVAHGSGEEARRIQRDHPSAVIARVRWEAEGEEGIVYDAMYGKGFAAALLEFIGRHRRRRGAEGELTALRTDAYHRILGTGDRTLDPVLLKAEQSNTSIAYGDRFILKLFRQLQPGVNPDLELGRFLTERECPHTPPVAGAVEYRRNHQDPLTVAILHGFTANQGDAWEYTKDVLGHYFELVVAHRARWKEISAPQKTPLDLLQVEPPPFVGELIGPYWESARLLGRRTAELHVLLASEADDPHFAPEPFSTLYQRALYQSMRNLTVQVLGLLHQRRNDLPERFRPLARGVLEREERILEMFRVLTKRKITAMRIRCHGDLHLGQVLHTGKDFVIIDFEGEPVRPITERRIKRCPLRDVAGMLRSFHYASQSALLEQVEGAVFQPEDVQNLENGAVFWHVWVSVAYLSAYREIADEADFLPHSSEEFQMLLDIYLLEKAVYELGYELNNRPGWVGIPLKGVQQVLGAAE